ncbi:MAG: response regulator transcription factor [Polyangiales bacterium]
MSETALVRLLVADDHPIVAEGLRRYLAPAEGLRVVDTLGTIGELLARLSDPAAEPIDVVVLDVQIPGMEAGDTVRAIRRAGPHVVLFTHQRPDDYVARMVAAGAEGYVSKSDPVTDLVRAVQAVQAGRSFLSEELRALAARITDSAPPHAALTEREHTVFILLARGATPKEVGFDLGLSGSTVYSHIEKIRQKLGATNLADIQRYGERWGFTDPPPER